MNAYGPVFAKKFVKGQGQWLSRTIGPNIQKFYQSTPVGAKNRNLLDIACGAGILVQYFAQEAYHVTGMDLSAPMIELAKHNNRDFIKKGLVILKCQDITRFALPATIGLAVGIGQIPNHLADFSAFRECSESVFKSLVQGGYFLADILLDTTPRQKPKPNIFPRKSTITTNKGWTNLDLTDNDNELSVNISIYDPVEKINILHSSGFVQFGNKFEKYQETLYLTYYNMLEVIEMLKSTGFQHIYFAELEDLATAKNVEKIQGFKFLVAQK